MADSWWRFQTKRALSRLAIGQFSSRSFVRSVRLLLWCSCGVRVCWLFGLYDVRPYVICFWPSDWLAVVASIVSSSLSSPQLWIVLFSVESAMITVRNTRIIFSSLSLMFFCLWRGIFLHGLLWIIKDSKQIFIISIITAISVGMHMPVIVKTAGLPACRVHCKAAAGLDQ